MMKNEITNSKIQSYKFKEVYSKSRQKNYISPTPVTKSLNKSANGLFMLKKDVFLKNLVEKNKNQSQNRNSFDKLTLKNTPYFNVEKEYFTINNEVKPKLDRILSIVNISENKNSQVKLNLKRSQPIKNNKIRKVNCLKDSELRNYRDLRIKFPKLTFKAKSMCAFDIKTTGQFNSFFDTNITKFSRKEPNIKQKPQGVDHTINNFSSTITIPSKNISHFTRLQTNTYEPNYTSNINTYEPNYTSSNYVSHIYYTKDSSTQTQNASLSSNLPGRDSLKSKLKNLLIKKSLKLGPSHGKAEKFNNFLHCQNMPISKFKLKPDIGDISNNISEINRIFTINTDMDSTTSISPWKIQVS